ncbi:MAG: hypothetical protein WC365_08405 [Candidatus Babeliales bacterium]|jgi:hypothetical protein
MKLSMEVVKQILKEVDDVRQYKIDNYLSRSVLEEGLRLMLKDFADTIEAQQQENEQLRDDLLTQSKARATLFEMVEQLQERNGAYREALTTISTGYSLGGDIDNLIDKALSATPTTYHNPADVEALAKARVALGGIIKSYEDDFAIEGLEGLCPREDAVLNYYTRPALAAIDKAVGEND